MSYKFVFDEWFKSGNKNSCKYSILKGGPNAAGEWVTTILLETSTKVEQREFTSAEAALFCDKLSKWITTWW